MLQPNADQLAPSSAARQTLQRPPLKNLYPALRSFCSLLLLGTTCSAQINDSLDSYPPRWHLATSDCAAEVLKQNNNPTGGVADSGCETITLKTGAGSEAIVEYRIEAVRVIDELTATVMLRAAKPGQRIGFRVRYPYMTNPQTRQPISVLLYGAEYRQPGVWQKVGIGAIASPLRLKAMALRREFGAAANLDDPFVDAVVVNAYTGAGETTLSIDNVHVDGLVAVTSMQSLFATRQQATRLPLTGTGPSDASNETSSGPSTPFPANQITRILQHNGEPLDWVRTLGFNAVLINRPPTERILREAMLARVAIIAPPPTAPDMALEPLLEPLIGYYLGTSLNQSNLQSTAATVDRIVKFPTRWQRPVMIAPAEAWRAFGSYADSIVHDLAPPVRGLAADEEIISLVDRVNRVGRPLSIVVGVPTDPPAALASQLDQISGSIGAPRGDDVPWHAMLLQVARALEVAPQAILYRSNRSLTSGLPEDQRRSMGLSYVNRYLEAIGPLAASVTKKEKIDCEGARFRCSRLDFPGGHVMIASSYLQQRGLSLAGDGDTLQLVLPPSDTTKVAYRVTHFSAERITVQTTSRGPRLEIVSPDLVETIVISSDPEMGGRLAAVLRRVASQAALDRWQLTREALDQLQTDWQTTTSSRILAANRPSIDLLNAAERTLSEAEPMFRSGDASSTMRMARRADAWQLRARWNLHAALSPGGQLSPTTSCPPLLSSGGISILLMWWPLMSDRGWSDNRLSGGGLDDRSQLGPAGWTFGRRSEQSTQADVKIIAGRQVEGGGCLVADVASVTGGTLPGGYAGTTIQIRSPGARFEAGTALRIDAKVRTLGFGGADQGVLVYDTIGGAELGVLVRAVPTWQTVRLYRQTTSAGEINVLFEAIGAGEFMIDDVQVRSWEPAASETIPMRRIAEVPIPSKS